MPPVLFCLSPLANCREKDRNPTLSPDDFMISDTVVCQTFLLPQSDFMQTNFFERKLAKYNWNRLEK
jgi:hypothetical protein